MGTLILSTDLLVSLYLNPMSKAFAFKDYQTACTFLYSFNEFFKGFKMGVDDLPEPKIPDMTDVMDRRSPFAYYKQYFERYYPMVSKILGIYQHKILEQIKDERGGQ